MNRSLAPYGVTSRSGAPVTTATRFQAGSISKLITDDDVVEKQQLA